MNRAKIRTLLWVLGVAVLLGAAHPGFAIAQAKDPFDPFDHERVTEPGEGDPDADKSVRQLITEAYLLQRDERLLDARTKLLKALAKEPNNYLVHVMLADYYLRHVGHFRLALKYVKRGLTLFTKQNGPPPYADNEARQAHMDLLNLLSNTRLNLDDYPGALAALDEFEAQGYYESWLPASRAWILMKLDRLEEAINTARLGLLAGGAPGHTLNILGILLSMTDHKEESLRIFDQAMREELSLGESGSPATPMNNAGEVYRELFREEDAARLWQRALRLPDGCEHVLPSLNLALVRMEETNYTDAAKAMDDFESCVAQFPLRNGEEHRALVQLIRGRIAMHTGRVDEAIPLLQSALDRQQWFGKIGTSQQDMRVAGMISLAQALRRKNNLLQLYLPAGLRERASVLRAKTANALRAWWLMRRARQMLAEDLKDVEDLYIRHTDSLLEYQTLGELLAGFPLPLAEKRLALERRRDERPLADVYYKTFLAESLLAHSENARARELLDDVLHTARPTYDSAIETHAALLRMRLEPKNSESYSQLADRVFAIDRSELPNAALPLPVNYSGISKDDLRLLGGSAFYPDNSRGRLCSIRGATEADQVVLTFSCASAPVANVRIAAPDMREAINNLTKSAFTRD